MRDESQLVVLKSSWRNNKWQHENVNPCRGWFRERRLSSVIALKQLIKSWLESGDNLIRQRQRRNISVVSRILLRSHGIHSPEIVARSLV